MQYSCDPQCKKSGHDYFFRYVYQFLFNLASCFPNMLPNFSSFLPICSRFLWNFHRLSQLFPSFSQLSHSFFNFSQLFHVFSQVLPRLYFPPPPSPLRGGEPAQATAFTGAGAALTCQAGGGYNMVQVRYGYLKLYIYWLVVWNIYYFSIDWTGM